MVIKMVDTDIVYNIIDSKDLTTMFQHFIWFRRNQIKSNLFSEDPWRVWDQRKGRVIRRSDAKGKGKRVSTLVSSPTLHPSSLHVVRVRTRDP